MKDLKLFVVQWNPNNGLWFCPHYDRVWAESIEEAEKSYLNDKTIHLTGPTHETEPYPGEKPKSFSSEN